MRTVFRVTALALSLAAIPSIASAQARGAQVRRTPVSPYAVPAAIASGASLGGGLALFLALPSDTSAKTDRWRGGILADEDFRTSFRLQAEPDQEMARQVSDVMLVATMAQAAIVDALLVPLLQGDPDLAWQASFAHSLSLGLTLGAGQIVKSLVGRARPFERECESDPQRPGCGGSDRFHSFYSLHTGMAFTSAGFSCAMHLSRQLYDDPGADMASCGASLAMASATGLLRVASDRHYLSDVVIGALLGFAIGYLIPLVVVPERPRVHDDPLVAERDEGESIPESPRMSWSVAPMLSAPSSALTPMADGTQRDGAAGAQIGPNTAGLSTGGMNGAGGTIGVSISGTF